jgi:WD40-like Beta Propeller Repeat
MATASPPVSGPLGGGVILAQSWKSLYDRTQHDVVAIDAGTGRQTLLGALPGGVVNPYRFQRSADGSHVLATDQDMISAASLQAPTDASRALGFIDATKIIDACCKRDTTTSTDLSPRGDRIALVRHNGGPLEVVILDVGGGGLQRLSVPRGMDFFGGLSWAPDESALVAYGCRPCNQAQSPSQRQTPFHAHLYVIPLDGSPWRELLDVDNGMVTASWSPDGATLATTTWFCPSGSFMPRCDPAGSKTTLGTVPVAGGLPTTLAEGPALFGMAWAPDGTRIAYRTNDGLYVVSPDGTDLVRLDDGADAGPGWSPDGQWLVFQRSPLDFWIISAGGGAPRRIATGYAGAAW